MKVCQYEKSRGALTDPAWSLIIGQDSHGGQEPASPLHRVIHLVKLSSTSNSYFKKKNKKKNPFSVSPLNFLF